MMKFKKVFLQNKFLVFITIFTLLFFQTKAQTVHEIKESVGSYTEYRKAEFSYESSNIYFFKHTLSSVPDSKIFAFRFQFDASDETYKDSKILCTSVSSSSTDDQIRTALNSLEESQSSCIGGFNGQNSDRYDGIIKLDSTKTMIGIKLDLNGVKSFTARIFLRIQEAELDQKEQQKKVDEIYALSPQTVVISKFREYASKILFYSYTRELQMYYISDDAPYPEKLFSGNVLSVYTNPNMVRQKYKNANTMVLLTRPFTSIDSTGELFQFEVKFFSSTFLLDYFVSNNPLGRSKNSPLMINMTECENPYYVVLNYNTPEKKTSLYIDQVYGKIKTLSVAPTFSSIYWDDMIVDDMKQIETRYRYYELPAKAENHIDVYKVECSIPLLLNFYYIYEDDKIPNLDYGHVAIVTLKSYKTVSLPFSSDVNAPALAIEVFNPIKLPFIIIDDGQNENIVSKNCLIKSTPLTTSKPIIIRERGGDSDTRIIIKVGYRYNSWDKKGDNIYYNSILNLFVFYFPNDKDRLHFTYADLITSGTTTGDNIKYCYAASIASPILPSAENCYRVSLNNSYTLKVLNPLILYKDYDFDENVGYFISIKPNDKEQMEVKQFLHTYDTDERNIEGESNVIKFSAGSQAKTILTAPANKDAKEFVQITQCQNSDIKFKLIDAFSRKQTVIEETTIPAGKKNYFKIVDNILLETELILSGDSSNEVFVRHSGIRDVYNLEVIDNPSITFNSTLNQIIMQNPINNSYQRIEYTVYVGKKGEISSQGITLCSLAKTTNLTFYSKSTISYDKTANIPINFDKVGLKAGEEFEAIVYCEQKLETKMAFLSNVFTGIVGEIKTDAITEINKEYSQDTDYVYATGKATKDGKSLYFSFMPTEILDVPVGALRIELNKESTQTLSNVICAFADEGESPSGMIEAVEDVINVANPYCIGGKDYTNGKIYNYIFRYSYTKDKKPRKLVIKVVNNAGIDDDFTIYLRKGENTYINSTDFFEQREYGRREEYQKTLMPYILDLELIRGDPKGNYVSKILLYSRYLEMQMYYLDDKDEINMPILLFTGYIMLVYTKPDLADQKYHGKKLILLSQNLNGQKHDDLGNNFRFHTKMFKSTDQIEYFQSNNPVGRTLNYPLSLEMNTCSDTNKKYYYILNYNRAEDKKILYLDLLYGLMRNARAVTKINSNYWNDMISYDMTDIQNMQITLGENTQHTDIVEIECQTPLLANAYYNTESEQFLDLKRGDIAIKNLPGQMSTSITLDPSLSGTLYCSISAYNSKGDSDFTVDYGNGNSETVKGNSLKLTILLSPPKSVSIINNGNSESRFIFKVGLGVENSWIEEKRDIEGKLYSKDNKYVYKFPQGNNKRNFTNVEILVKPLRKESGEISPNLKFCYSTSIGMAIDTSKENCFRTGANIPYVLTFINPLIAPKNYKTTVDNYYVTFSPWIYAEYITLTFTENKYDVEKRSMEGIPTILNFENKYEMGIILSALADSDNDKIFVQLQACSVSQFDNITYLNLNAYSKEEGDKGPLKKNSRLFYYTLNNNQMEAEIDFKGFTNDKVFVKHKGITGSVQEIGEYYTTWIESKNTVNIRKPILNNEAFRITVLVAKKGHFDSYSLCTFVETPFDKYNTLGDYVYTFTSVSSDVVSHYIEFSTISGYSLGTEFDLLVYAVQVNNMQVEVLYNVISGRVGKIEGIEEVRGTIIGKKDYVTHLFVQNITTFNNYLYYNFASEPVGDIASLKITQVDDGTQSTGPIIGKVGCTFVNSGASPEEMIAKVNEAERSLKNLCASQSLKDSDGFDAIINANDIKNGNTKLVILVRYLLGNDKETNDDHILNITIRTTGYEINKEGFEYNEDEHLTMVPYVLNLKKIREMQKENYHSKVLIYSSTRELEMYYIKDGTPVELFSGNIMMVYTNEKVIKEKYQGASTMILLTNSLNKEPPIVFSERFKFKVFFYNSATQIQYYVSANSAGRNLNNPTSIEMLSCDQPYYYILNYHRTEGDRMLHIDNIFGEINTTKFTDELNADSWDTLISTMKEFKGDQLLIKAQPRYHIDVFEVTCKTPLLLNLYYTDESNPKKNGLKQGDVSIITLHPNTNEDLNFIDNIIGERFIFGFGVHRNYGNPNIRISYQKDIDNDFTADKNGIYITNTTEKYEQIHISNKQLTGSDTTKIIFKFGYNIYETFTPIENDLYNLQTENREYNLFAYVFKKGEDRLNYTKVDFEVKTSEENVKFCYSTNFGSYINPSQQNCFRVGYDNSYTITIMNPYIMHKNYYLGDGVMDYYVSFQTVKNESNITIIPKLYKYDTDIRNDPETAKTLFVDTTGKTILTNPSNQQYLFVQMEICTPERAIKYEFRNAFYDVSLGKNGEIQSGEKYTYKCFENSKLDTELVISTDYNDVEMFVKHTGLPEEFQPFVNDIKIKYKDNLLNFTQPIEDEEFEYTILLDKKDNLRNKDYTLCSFSSEGKKAYFIDKVTSSEKEISYELDFTKEELEGYEEFDVLILAKQVNNGKMWILSDIFTPKEDPNKEAEKERKTLIIVIVILTVVCVVGGVSLYLYLRKLKNRPRGAIMAKTTDFDDIQDATAGEKMLDRYTQSRASEVV